MKKIFIVIVVFLHGGLVWASFDLLPSETFLKEDVSQNLTRLEIRSRQGEVFGSIDYDVLHQVFSLRDENGEIDSRATLKIQRELYGFHHKIIELRDAGDFTIGSIEQYPEESYLLLKDRQGEVMAFVDQTQTKGLHFIVRDQDQQKIIQIERAYLGRVSGGDVWRMRAVENIDFRLVRSLFFVAAVTTRSDYFNKTLAFYSAALKHSKSYAFAFFIKSSRHSPILKKIHDDYTYESMKYKYHRDYEWGQFLKRFKLKANSYTRSELRQVFNQEKAKLLNELNQAKVSDEIAQQSLAAGKKLGKIARTKLELERLQFEQKAFFRAGWKKDAQNRDEQASRIQSELEELNQEFTRSKKQMTEQSLLATEYIEKFADIDRGFSTLEDEYDLERYYIHLLGLGEQFTLTDLRKARDKKLKVAMKARSKSKKSTAEIIEQMTEAQTYLERFFLNKTEIAARRKRFEDAAGFDVEKRKVIARYFDALMGADTDLLLRDYYLRMFNLSPYSSKKDVLKTAEKLFKAEDPQGDNREWALFRVQEIEKGKNHLLKFFEENRTIEKKNRSFSWWKKWQSYFFPGFREEARYLVNPTTVYEYEEMQWDEDDL